MSPVSSKRLGRARAMNRYFALVVMAGGCLFGELRAAPVASCEEAPPTQAVTQYSACTRCYLRASRPWSGCDRARIPRGVSRHGSTRSMGARPRVDLLVSDHGRGERPGVRRVRYGSEGCRGRFRFIRRNLRHPFIDRGGRCGIAGIPGGLQNRLLRGARRHRRLKVRPVAELNRIGSRQQKKRGGQVLNYEKSIFQDAALGH
jgi:hypothetical protein